MSAPVLTGGKWIIGFHDGGAKNWWDIFTRPGYRHCFAIRYLEPMDAWALVDWSNRGLFVEFLPKRFIDAMILGVNDAGGSFLEFEARRRGRRILPVAPLYCVTAVKDLLGISGCMAVTPWQLYSALKKLGAKRIFELPNTQENPDGQPVQSR